MHGIIPARGADAICASARLGSEKTSTAQMGSEPDNAWFSGPARILLGSDPGLGLHVLTGTPERTSYRYTSGERSVPGYIIRQLLRGPHGEQWLAALMDGCGAEWWLEIQRARRIAAALDQVK